MATVNSVTVPNLGVEFDIGVATASKITIKTDATITKSAAGVLSVDTSALGIVSSDAGNLITVGTDDGAFFDQAALQAAETVFAPTVATGSEFLSIASAGTNGHAPAFSINYADAAFAEAVTDLVGSMVVDAADGIVFDDVANTIASTLGNLMFGNGLVSNGSTDVAVLPDPASVSTVSVSAAGVSVTPVASAAAGNLASINADGIMVDPAGVTALATVDVCDAFGVHLFDAMP